MTSYVFVDFEASSLRPESCPIEIGWCDESGQGEAFLIRPEEAWTDWSTESEMVHGISRDQLLAEGVSAAEVARRAHAVLGRSGVTVTVSSQSHDGMWLAQLLEVAGLPCPRVHSNFQAYGQAAIALMTLLPDPKQADFPQRRAHVRSLAIRFVGEAVEAEERRGPVRHRALDDAKAM